MEINQLKGLTLKIRGRKLGRSVNLPGFFKGKGVLRRKKNSKQKGVK